MKNKLLPNFYLSGSSDSDDEGNVAIKKSRKSHHNPLVQGVRLLLSKVSCYLGCPNLILYLLSPGPIGLGEIILKNQRRKSIFNDIFSNLIFRLILLFATKILQSVEIWYV